MQQPKVITIDGPSGSGKGTISRLVAQELGWIMLDSGAVYRGLALRVLDDFCSFNDVGRIVELASELPLEFIGDQVLLNGEDVTHKIRSEACGDVASKIAVFEPVRVTLLQRQRDFAKMPGLVADGRDMGTIVFPEAFLKIYLDASVDERAKRRFLQLKQSGFDVNLADLEADIMQRDVRDKSRTVAPLLPADDAVVVDTSNMGIDEVFKLIVGMARERLS